jgi:hypothetical protein
MGDEAHVDEMCRAAAVDPETMIGICEGGFPLTADDRCQFCGATWKDKCARRDYGLSQPYHIAPHQK